MRHQATLFDAPPVPTPADDGQLRDYQVDVQERARAHMKAGRKRGIVQMPTGGGKSHCIADMCRSALEKRKRVLILADRRKLVKQLGATLGKFQVPFGVIMAGETYLPSLSVITASRDTLVAWMRREMKMPDPFDLVIPDECHGIMGDTYQLLLSLYPNAFSVGFTATPARGDGRFLSDYYQWLECSVSVSELVRRGWLVPVEVYWPVKSRKKRRKADNTKALLYGDPVGHWKMLAEGLPTIAFCADVNASLSLRDQFLREGVAADHVDAESSDSERERLYKQLQDGDIKVLCSVSLLTQGVDFPEVSCIIIRKRMGSIVEFLQSVGRAMRPCPRIGKKVAIVLDHTGAVGEHGDPGEDRAWSLDPDSTLQGRRLEDLANGQAKPVMVCRACGFCFPARTACPKCGERAPKVRKTFSLEEQCQQHAALLQRYDGSTDAEAVEIVRNANLKIYNKVLAIAANRNGTFKMVNIMFKNQTGKWLSDVDLGPDARTPPQHRLHEKIADIFPELVRRKAPT